MESIRLVSASGSSEKAKSEPVTSGRLEVLVNMTWGTVCSSGSFGTEEAVTACRQLGFSVSSPHFSPTANAEYEIF